MMKRLWVRLSFAFAAIMAIFAAIVLAVFLFFTDARRLVRTAVITNINESTLPAQMVQIYERDQSWETLTVWLRGLENVASIIQDTPVRLILADAEGQIIFAPDDISQNDETLSRERLDSAVLLMSGDEVIGYMDVDMGIWELSEQAEAVLIEDIQRTISIIMGVASIFGIILGIVISRTLTAPLEHLAVWAASVRDRRADKALILDGSVEVTSLVETINDMVGALRTSETLRRNLVADVAHELRTPLTVLQGNLYAILDDVYPCDKEQIATLYDQTRVLSRLVNDLHELSQVEANQTPMQSRSVDLNHLISDAVEQFQVQAEQKNISLARDGVEQLPLIQGDPDRLYQVLNNLLSNAIRHSPMGENVALTANTGAEQITLTVSNTGSAIPPHHLPHIFERFYRVDRARDRSHGGAGLGLAIARAIVEAHGGSINANSNDQLTEFTVNLPKVAAH